MSDEQIISEFVADAEAFCALIDSCDQLSASDFLRQCAPLIATLYHSGLNLKSLPLQAEDDDAEYPMDLVDGEFICRRLADKLWDRRYYWEVFDPREDSDPVTGDLVDDLADIYHDVKTGLVLFQRDYSQEAVWRWTFDFSVHWGDHLVDALRVMHRLISKAES